MSEASAKKRRELTARDLEQRKLDLKAIMSLPAGRRFFAGLLLGTNGLLDGSFVFNGLDGQRATDRNEGRKELLRELLQEVQEAAEDAAETMVVEWFREAAGRKRMLRALAVPNRDEAVRP